MNFLLDRFNTELDRVVEATARLASVAADRAVAIDAARLRCEALAADDSPHERWRVRRILVTEIACALRLPERSTETLIAHSRALVHEFPATLAAVQSGTVSYRHATILLDQAAGLSAENAAVLETLMLPAAAGLTAAKFTDRVRKTRERLDVGSIRIRQEKCVADRAVFFEPARDGMAYLSAYLPAVQAQAIYARVTTTAMGLQGPTEPRTLTQLRADVLADLVLIRDTGSSRDRDRRRGRGRGNGNDVGTGRGTATGSGSGGSSGTGADSAGSGTGANSPGRAAGRFAGIKPDVALLVPVLSLLGRSDEPATLEGYGPISVADATELVGNATSFVRILTHPETGAILSVGRKRYAAPTDLRTVLRLRDETCRHPGCNRPAAQCDIDHTLAFTANGENGDTTLTNLAHLCEQHHRDKHETGWTVRQDPSGDGTLHWISPTGRHYSTEPAHRIGPTRPHAAANQSGPRPRRHRAPLPEHPPF